MQHCTSQLFFNNLFCPDCGDKVTEPLTIKPIEIYHPDILDNLKEHCPDASVYTGWVESTHFYKRLYRSSGKDSETLYYSYWFLTLNNEKNEPFTISISSEDSSLDSVIKGDVLTFLHPTNYTLYYKLANANDSNIVTHNNAAPVVIFHRKSGQESILEPAYEVENFSKFGTFFSTLLLVAVATVAGFLFELFNIETAYIITGLLTVFGSIYRIKGKTKVFETQTKRLDEIKRTIKRILGVSISDMGYDSRAREINNDDVYCIGCENLIDSHYQYCPCCSQSQETESSALLTASPQKMMVDKVDATIDVKLSPEQQALAMTSPLNNMASIVPHRLTRQEKVLQECQAYTTDEKTEHLQKYLFDEDYQCIFTTSSNIIKVTDKDIATSVSDNTHVTQTTTRTDYKNRYGSTVRSQYRTETSSHRQRDSTLYGELTIETPEGEVKSFKAEKSLLGSADVGDWLLIGSSTAEGKAGRSDYNEFYYNISKDTLIEPESLTHWQRKSSKSQFIGWSLFLLSFAASFAFSHPAAIFVVVLVSIIISVSARRFSRHTKEKTRSTLAPLYETLKRCKQERESFLKI